MSGMGKLTTHVLDLSNGRPASGMRLELRRLPEEEGKAELIRAWITNIDGRVDQALLEGEEMQAGVYELVFASGNYYRGLGCSGLDPVIFELIPIRFCIYDREAHYHIPLLISLGGYSTYRGS